MAKKIDPPASPAAVPPSSDQGPGPGPDAGAAASSSGTPAGPGNSPPTAPPSNGGAPPVVLSEDTGPQAAPIPAQVKRAGAELSEANDEPDPNQGPVPTSGVINEVKQKLEPVLNEPSISQECILLVRLFIQLILLHLRTPPTLKMLAHTDNAATLLLPAVDNMLEQAAAIQAAEPKAFRRIDLKVVAQQRETLAGLREIQKAFTVAAHCVEAGATHVETFLDSVTRTVYFRSKGGINEDFLLQQDLPALMTLATITGVTGQETKRTKAVVAHQTEAGTLARVGMQPGPGPGPGTGAAPGQGNAGGPGQGPPGPGGGGVPAPGSSLPAPQHPMPPRRKPRLGSPARPGKSPRPGKTPPRAPKKF